MNEGANDITIKDDVLIPLNSGLVFEWRRAKPSESTSVLIPLNSGLVFEYYSFADGLRFLVLIPLNSGLVFEYAAKKGKAK